MENESCFDANEKNFDKKVLKETSAPVIVDFHASFDVCVAWADVQMVRPVSGHHTYFGRHCQGVERKGSDASMSNKTVEIGES